MGSCSGITQLNKPDVIKVSLSNRCSSHAGTGNKFKDRRGENMKARLLWLSLERWQAINRRLNIRLLYHRFL